MDYSAVVDSIPAEHLDLVETLWENRLQLLDTLHSVLVNLEDILPVIAQYCKLKSDISSMLKDMDALERTLVSRISWNFKMASSTAIQNGSVQSHKIK